jgi:methionyl aminopeptidase
MAIYLKSNREIELMSKAGRIVGQTLQLLAEHVKPGVTTGELDAMAYKFITSQGAIPTFKGYHPFPSVQPFPGSICSSVNEEIVHGIPGGRMLEEGDIVALDCGAIYRGWHGDSAVTVGVGNISPELRKLLDDTQAALQVGIANAKPGVRLGDLCEAIERKIYEGGDYGIVREYGGHGIGRSLWEEPSVPNWWGNNGRGVTLRPGVVIAIEPMLNLGTHETETLGDGWTVVTKDRKPSAHFEHTVAVTDNGPQILTLP